jgi:methyl coenzyme M reductase subunit C
MTKFCQCLDYAMKNAGLCISTLVHDKHCGIPDNKTMHDLYAGHFAFTVYLK